MNRTIAVLAVILGLNACQKSDAQIAAERGLTASEAGRGELREIWVPNGANVYIWTDPDTGCEFYHDKANGLAGQRFNADGSPRCKVRVSPADLSPSPPAADPQGRAADLTGRRQ